MRTKWIACLGRGPMPRSTRPPGSTNAASTRVNTKFSRSVTYFDKASHIFSLLKPKGICLNIYPHIQILPTETKMFLA